MPVDASMRAALDISPLRARLERIIDTVSAHYAHGDATRSCIHPLVRQAADRGVLEAALDNVCYNARKAHWLRISA